MKIENKKEVIIVKKTVVVIALIIMIMALMFILTGCTSSISYTYKVTTGDTIQIKLNNSDGYDITSEVPFKITKADTTISQGTFITLDGYEQYIATVNSTSTSKVIDKGSKNGIEYTFYSYNGQEFNYIIKVEGSKTGILIGNAISEESAKECFERLTFSKQ